MKPVLIVALLLSACSGSTAAPKASPAPAATAGPGIKVDAATGTISIDSAVVPTAPSCASGQVVRRTATGWACAAAAPDASNLGGQPASYYLAATAQAADSGKLNGKSDTAFLAATATATDSAKLGCQPAASYLSTSGTAANSAKLGGQLPSAFLGATAKAQSAITSDQLGGIGAARYFRNDLGNQTVPALVTVGDPNGTRLIIGANGTSDLFGSNFGTGNLHLDSDGTGTDGRVYFNWFSGNGVAIANGAQVEVASFDHSGNLKAASFNGMKITGPFTNLAVGTGLGCDWICTAQHAATCVSAKYANAANTTPVTPTLCSTVTGQASVWSFSCMCSSF